MDRHVARSSIDHPPDTRNVGENVPRRLEIHSAILQLKNIKAPGRQYSGRITECRYGN